MTPNPLMNRLAAMVLIAMVYVAGASTGHDQAMQAHSQHPACHPNLKP
jgi:hypothetical protein